MPLYNSVNVSSFRESFVCYLPCVVHAFSGVRLIGIRFGSRDLKPVESEWVGEVGRSCCCSCLLPSGACVLPCQGIPSVFSVHIFI